MWDWWHDLVGGPLHGERVRGRIARHRVTPIASVADHAVACIAGVVEPVSTRYTPMTNVPCAAWFISLEEVGAGESRFAGTLSCAGEMLVRDATGAATVVLEHVRFALRSTHVESRRDQAMNRWTPTQRDAFARSGVTMNHRTSGVRFREHVILPGMRVHVLGHAQREIDRTLIDANVSGYRGDPPTRPSFATTRKVPLLVADSTWLPARSP